MAQGHDAVGLLYNGDPHCLTQLHVARRARADQVPRRCQRYSQADPETPHNHRLGAAGNHQRFTRARIEGAPGQGDTVSLPRQRCGRWPAIGEGPGKLRLLLKKGEKVKAGQLIGFVSNTGNAGADHPQPHFEVRYGNPGTSLPPRVTINPYYDLPADPRLYYKYLLIVVGICMSQYGKVGIVALLLFANVHSALGCERFDDKPDKYNLGRYLMESLHPELTSTEQVQKCVQGKISNCLYRDNEGLVYGLFGDDSDIAASIQMLHPRVLGVSADKTYTGRLIADLKIGDTMEDVRQKLKSLPPEFPNWDLETDGSGPKLVTACRIRSSNNAEWYYVLRFDSEGKLESVDAEQDDPEAAI